MLCKHCLNSTSCSSCGTGIASLGHTSRVHSSSSFLFKMQTFLLRLVMTHDILTNSSLLYSGLVFGKLTGTGRNALKTDVIHFFEGCNLSTTDIKVEYNKAYNPLGMYVFLLLSCFIDLVPVGFHG